MKVRELIERLSRLDPELPVYVADWHEGVGSPSAEQAEILNVVDEPYWSDEPDPFNRAPRAPGPVLVIGDGE